MSEPTAPDHTARWRAATIACLLVMLVAVTAVWSMFEQFKAQLTHVQTQLQTTSQIQYLAVLLDAKQNPALLVTLDPREGALQLQRLNDVREGRDDSLHLWALPAGGTPVLLGVLQGKTKTLQLRVDAGALPEAAQLAISVESKSKVEQVRAPALPYLWTGAWVKKAL